MFDAQPRGSRRRVVRSDDSSLQAVAGALSEMQDSISNGRVKSSRITENDKDYAVFDVDADRKYTVKITVSNTGDCSPSCVTAPASKWRSEKLCSIAWSVLSPCIRTRRNLCKTTTN